MPKNALPPTPASSTEIKAKRVDEAFSPQKELDLPPSAMTHANNDFPKLAKRHSTVPDAPISPNSPQHAAALAPEKSGASIKPSKFIQVKPRKSSTRAKEAIKEDITNAEASTATATTSKRKSVSSSTAGKKVARKTAHSLIERRRRSKMNDEFDELREMIPGCADQEMHKLAILQAANDYMRRLKSSVESHPDLSKANVTPSAGNTPDQTHLDKEEQHYAKETSAAIGDASHRSHKNTDRHDRSGSRSYYADSTGPSPMLSAFSQSAGDSVSELLPEPPSSNNWHERGPRGLRQPMSDPAYTISSSRFDSTRTTEEQDHEASAALLMLNASDRRNRVQAQPGERGKNDVKPAGQRSTAPSRGISVRDLLSG